ANRAARFYRSIRFRVKSDRLLDDEFQQQAAHLRRLLQVRHMAGTGEHVYPHGCRQPLGLTRGNDLILRAPDNLHRNITKLAEPPAQDFVLPALEIRCPYRRQRLARTIQPLEAQEVLDHVTAHQALVDEQLRQYRLELFAPVGRDEVAGEILIDLLAESRRTDQRERGDMRGTVERRP